LVGSETQNISNCDRLAFYSGQGFRQPYRKLYPDDQERWSI